MLTAERARELFNYDPLTGVLTWRVTRGSRAAAGDVVGAANAKGYLCFESGGRSYTVHQIAWLYIHGAWADQIDHKDTNKANNAIGNLRPATTQQNCAGRTLRRDNVTGFKGVGKVAPGVWRARIRVDYRGIDLGRYLSAEDAAHAYDVAALLHFGEFARTNKMLGLLP